MNEWEIKCRRSFSTMHLVYYCNKWHPVSEVMTFKPYKQAAGYLL